jgi:sulfate/thiosulfate transport system permease protein
MTGRRARHVLPGFGLSLGYTLLYLGAIVLLPLSAAFIKAKPAQSRNPPLPNW